MVDGNSYDDLIARRDALLQRKLDNLAVLDKVRQEVDLARGNAAAYRRFADPNWFAKRNAEVRNRGRQDQQMALELANIKRQLQSLEEQHHQHSKGVEGRFVDVARLRLPREIFEALLAEAKAFSEIAQEQRLTAAQRLEAEGRFWQMLRTAEQKGHDRPVNLQALRGLSYQKPRGSRQ